ncbi:hypothetical protein HDU67_006166 [Dinochytrium kinnereticum]|nr:hypothetical protein HDU67_006166 [Dinochytrium kinnereticum]
MECEGNVPPTITDQTVSNSNRDVTYVLYAVLKRLGEETLVVRKDITIRRGIPWAEPKKVLLDGPMLENMVTYQLFVPELVYIGDPTASIMILLKSYNNPLQLKTIQCTWVEVLTYDEEPGKPATQRENILSKVLRTSDTFPSNTSEIMQKFEIPNTDTSPDCDHRAAHHLTHPLLKAYGGAAMVHHEVRIKVEYKRDRQVVLLVDGIMTKIPFACVVHPGSGGVRQRMDTAPSSVGLPSHGSSLTITRGSSRLNDTVSRSSSRNSSSSSNSLPRLDNRSPPSLNGVYPQQRGSLDFNRNDHHPHPISTPSNLTSTPHPASTLQHHHQIAQIEDSTARLAISTNPVRSSLDPYPTNPSYPPQSQPQPSPQLQQQQQIITSPSHPNSADGTAYPPPIPLPGTASSPTYPTLNHPDEPPPPFETLSRAHLDGGGEERPAAAAAVAAALDVVVVQEGGGGNGQDEVATLDYLVGMQKNANSAHEPEDEDEIAVAVGDMLFVRQAWVDGYAYGMNLTTFTEGIFPQSCLFGDTTATTPAVPNSPPPTSPPQVLSPRATVRTASLLSRGTRSGPTTPPQQQVASSPPPVQPQPTVRSNTVWNRVAVPLNQHRALHGFLGRAVEELGVDVGDVVTLDEVYENEWGLGINSKTSQRGWYPLTILGPDFGGPPSGGHIYPPSIPAPPIPAVPPSPVLGIGGIASGGGDGGDGGDGEVLVNPFPEDEDDFLPIPVPVPAVKPVPPPRAPVAPPPRSVPVGAAVAIMQNGGGNVGGAGGVTVSPPVEIPSARVYSPTSPPMTLDGSATSNSPRGYGAPSSPPVEVHSASMPQHPPAPPRSPPHHPQSPPGAGAQPAPVLPISPVVDRSRRMILTCSAVELGELFLVGAIDLGEFVKMRRALDELEALEGLVLDGRIDGLTFLGWKGGVYERAVGV